MPDIPQDFPLINSNVWVWDTWPLADLRANQLSYKGWEVIFSLTADPHAGYVRRPSRPCAHRLLLPSRGHPASQRPRTAAGGRPPVPRRRQRQGVRHRADDQQRRMVEPRGSRTATTSASTTPRRRSTARRQAADITRRRRSSRAPTAHPRRRHARLVQRLRRSKALLQPDGNYQSGQQNTYFSFRDPFVFTDPAHPGKTYMVFEGNTAARAVHAPAPTRISATRRTIRTRKISTR